MPELNVEFDQPQEVFFPGQPISGRVLLSTSVRYKACAVVVKFKGRACTDWDDFESMRKVDSEGTTHIEERRVNYSATVNYLDHEMLLWASRSRSYELPPGRHTWPFSFTLPTTIPPSFEGKFGCVRYSVTAEIDRPERLYRSKKRLITVSPLLDLNAMPSAMLPIHDEESENIGICCFRKGYLELIVDIPKTGFVPGETVPMNLHILNHGSVPVNAVKAKILQISNFIAFRHGHTTNYAGDTINSTSRRESREVTNHVIRVIQAVSVPPGRERKMSLEVRIPSVTPTVNQFCPIIFVEYVVRVSADTSSSFNSSVDCELPIIIGTMPIRQFLPPAYPSQPYPLPTSPYRFQPGIGEDVSPMSPPPPYSEIDVPPASAVPKKGRIVVPSAPPLSYEESMYGTEGTQLRTEENERPFVPKYPVFNDLPVYNPTAPPRECNNLHKRKKMRA